jgi:hypothetical protein
VQERELSLIREYETKLLGLEDENSGQELRQHTETSESLRRIANLLRQLLRTQGGEEGIGGEMEEVEEDEEEEEWGAWKSVGQGSADYGLEREIELARLEKEHEELKRMMGLLPAQLRLESQRMASGLRG